MSRPARIRLLPPAALCIALLLSSCAGGDSGDPAGAPATQDADVVSTPESVSPTPPSEPTTDPSTDPSAEPTTDPTAEPSAEPTSDGDVSTYTTSDGSLAFDHPTDWSVADAAEVPAQGVSVVVTSPDGRQLAALQTDLVTGAVCPAELPYLLLDSEPLPALAQDAGTPRFVFEGRMDPAVTDPMKQSTLAYGITAAPEPTGPTACPISHFFTWPPSGAAFGGTYDPFAIYPGKPMHVDTPHAYMETEEYQEIRAMITSLRPAG